MTEIVDFFFSPFPSAQEKRLQAAVDDGLAHVSRIEPRDPRPGEAVTLLFSSNTQLPIERVAVYYTVDGSQPAGRRGLTEQGDVVIAKMGEIVYDERLRKEVRQWRAVLPGQPDGQLVRYCADGWSLSAAGQRWCADAVDPVGASEQGSRSFAYHVDTWSTPQWWYDAIVYQIFVDRFNAATNEPALREYGEREITDFFGGSLRGILEKLDYIQELGINCIWLSPVFESPTHHGYNPSDYRHVAQRFGGDEALHQLIQEAHQRGMRVLLDFAANHTSDKHPAFLAALKDPASPFASWYSFNGERYQSFANVRDMPELRTDHPEVLHYLIEAALYWLEHFGADGLRLDYMPGPSHTFWARFQAAVKERYPEAITIGEITAPLQDIVNYAGRVDGFMDFPLAKMLRDTFAWRKSTLADLVSFLDEYSAQLPTEMSRGTLLDNHDSHRFLWLAGGDIERLKLAAACHLTLEGTPIIYYGTEVGLSQYADAHKETAHARAPMFWDERQRQDLLAHYQRLTHLRQSYPALRTGSRAAVSATTVEAADAAQVGAYLRYQDGCYLLIVLNNNEASAHIRLAPVPTLSGAGCPVQGSLTLRDLLHPGHEYSLQGSEFTLELPALNAIILEVYQAG
ncbi:MAG: glycoside hydrolase family 13 protein [Ktedonobacteraceae bacterium]|nr:glycoside hydrolase family 13 protein [Ktedonobacteraceae bacterium]